MRKDKPHNRSFLIKIGQLNVRTLSESILLQDYLEIHICGIINNILKSSNLDIYGYLTGNSSLHLDIRYCYSEDKIANFIYEAMSINIPDCLTPFLYSLTHTITKHLEEVIYEFYMSEFKEVGCLNINSILINGDSLFITCEFLERE